MLLDVKMFPHSKSRHFLERSPHVFILLAAYCLTSKSAINILYPLIKEETESSSHS